jgi:hypothetical protein
MASVSLNSGPFGYKFKVGDTADVEKADEHYFDFGLSTFMASLETISVV